MKIQKIPEKPNTSGIKHETLIQEKKSLHLAGRLSVIALKTILKTAQRCLIPSVKAAAKEEPPNQPPPMKYKDLPMYACPHLKWKEYEIDKLKCADNKLLHEFIQPTVTEYRKQVVNNIKTFKNELGSTFTEVHRDLSSAGSNLLAKARCPKNKGVGTVVVVASGLAGLKYGKTIPRKIFCSGVFLFVTGSVFFPKETDETVRNVCYLVGKAFVPVYNFYFGTDWATRERVPCQKDLPTIPPPTAESLMCKPKK